MSLLTDFLNIIPKNSRVAIYGMMNVAEILLEKIFELRSDLNVKFFIDSKKEGVFNNIPVYKAENLDTLKEEIDAVIISSKTYKNYMNIVLKGFGIEQIFIPSDELFSYLFDLNVENTVKVFSSNEDKDLYRFLAKVQAHKEKYSKEIADYFYKRYPNRLIDGKYNPIEHYFEYIKCDKVKNAIDGGGFDGLNSIEALQYFPNVENVYMFEPCYKSFKTNIFDKIIELNPKIHVIEKALWKENGSVAFREDLEYSVGSAVIEVKPNITRKQRHIEVESITIDSFVESMNNVKIDYIKMDLENSELDALHGAERTLVEHRPQLAISIYHSNNHFYNIPKYLYNLLPDYEFKIAHYSYCVDDTVLYAIPKEILG